MRIIAGALKGRRLQAPRWEGLRPTSDKLRETIFNVLAHRVAGARVLDGYAGTGGLGIEALSRAAASVTFIESDRRAQALILENLTRCGLTNGYTILRTSMARGLETLKTAARFDIVLLDPPYAAPIDGALAGVDAIVAEGGVVVLEHSRRHTAPGAAGWLVRTREIRSGDSLLSLFSRAPGAEAGL